VRAQAKLYLDTRYPLTAQDDMALAKVYQLVRQYCSTLRITLTIKQVERKYTFLSQYEGNWVTEAMLMIYLRNSGAYQRQALG